MQSVESHNHIKVAYMLGSLNRGGTETLLLDVFRSAAQASFDFIGVYRKSGAYEEDFYKTGKPLFRLSPHHGRLITYLLQLRRLFRAQGVTIVHAQQSIDCLYAWMATIGTGIRVVETFHGYDFGFSRLARFLNRLSILLSDSVCFVSDTQRSYYIQRYGLQRYVKKLHVVYNGIDFSKFDLKYPVPDFLKKIDPTQSGIRLATVGNFVSVRSQSYICRSIEILKERGITDFDMYFVGKRNDKEPWRYDDCVNFCKEHSLDNVHFLGGRADVPAILQNIDAFVYSTDHDTFGIAVVEAMAAGLPVFVNDWGVMCEVVKEGMCKGVSLWETGKPESLANMLSDFFAAPETYYNSARQNKQNIREAFSIQRHVTRLAEIYKQI